MTESKVYVKRAFEVGPSELFPWLTRPDLIAQWFGPKGFRVGAAHSDPRPDGKYSIELIRPDGHRFVVTGRYVEVSPPFHLSFTLRYEGLSTSPPDSLVGMQIEAQGDSGCRLSLTQSFETAPKDMARRTQAWEHMLEVLSGLVE